MNRVLLLAVSPALAACGPPALAFATYAADGASYAVAGKMMADHGISVATAWNCEIIAGLPEGRPICIRSCPGSSDSGRGSRAVRGFSWSSAAERTAGRHASLGARVVPATVAGRLFHRAVVGQVPAAEAAALGPGAWKVPARGGGASGFARGR